MKKLLLFLSVLSCWTNSVVGQQNLALQATAAHSGGGSGAFGPAEYNNGVIAAGINQPWGWVSSNGWIEYTWTTPVTFQDIVLYDGGRKISGGQIEIWDAGTSAYVTVLASISPFISTTQGSVDSIVLPTRVTTTKLRLNSLAGSNPNFREIEVYEAPTGLNDAGVVSTSSVAAVCPGSYPVSVTVQNFGVNRIDSVMVNWSVDGVAQTPVWYNTQLDTVGGTGVSSATVALGSYAFATGTAYQLKSWTSLPNNAADTTNFNDTLNAQIALGAPTGFAASNVMPTSANLSWNALGGTNFRINYGSLGFNPQTGGSLATATGSSTTLSTLTANTQYEAYLVADCGAGSFSDTAGPISFNTPCTVVTAPFNENFDGIDWVSGTGAQNANSSINSCWTRTPDLALPTGFQMGPRNSAPNSGNGPLTDLTGGNFVYGEASYGGSGDIASLLSPPIDVSGLTTPGLYFFQHRYSAGGSIADMYVEISNDFGTSWDTLYSITGEVQTSASDPWSLEFVNLVAYTGDTIMVKFLQKSNGCCGDAAIDSVVVDEAPTCPWPTNLSVLNTTDSSAVISWNDPTGSAWEVIWGPPGFSQASPNTGTHNTTQNPDTILNLQSNTAYEFYVRTDCGTNGNSIWIGPMAFRTECSPYSAPYFTNYDNSVSTNIPFCWGNYINGAGSSFAQAYTLSTANSFSAPNALYIYNYVGTSLASDTVIAISPKFSDIGLGDKQLRFKAYSASAGATLIIGSMTYGSGGNSITPFDTISLTSGYQEFIVPITTANGYNGTDSYIGLMHGQSGTVQTIYVDDFNYELIPPCPPPSSTSLGTAFVGSNSASLYWGMGVADSTKVEVGLVGFTPGIGTQSAATGTIDDTVMVTGLLPQTVYEFYINDTCYGTGNSGWIGPFSFTTACLPIAAPYTETFDGSSWILGNGGGSQTGTVDLCWTRDPDANSTWTWNVWNTTTSSGNTAPSTDYSGTGKFLYTDASYSNSSGNADIYSPLLDVSALTVPYVSFYYHRYGDLAEMGDMEVAVNDGSGWVTLLTLTGTDQTASTDPWKESGADVSAFGDTIQVRFRGVYVSCCQGDMAFDQFEVKEAPSCPNLVGLDVNPILDTSATVSWVSSSSATSYEVWFGPQGFYQGTATVGGAKGSTTNPSLIIDTLTSNSCYEFLVRSICGPGDTSSWSGPVSFCTECSPFTAPFYTGFDNQTAGAGVTPDCWTPYFVGGTGAFAAFEVYTPGTPQSVPNHVRFYNYNQDTTMGISPRFSDLNAGDKQIRFYAEVTTTLAPNTLIVGTVSDPSSGNTFSPIDTISLTNTPTEYTIEITVANGYNGTDNYIALMHGNESTFRTFYIDEFNYEVIPTCPNPTGFTVNSTSGNSATLGWNALSNAQGYVLEYGQGGFTPGTGTVVSVAGTSYTLNSLPQNNVAYQVYLRADCGGGDSSVWVGPLTIITDPNLCTEDFEVYNTGLIDGQSTLFIGWAGAPGDAEITTTRASSGTKSLHIYTTGPSASSDVVANLDSSFTSGIYSVKFNMFIPTSYGGYYNILHNYTGATNVWAIEVYIDANGTATVNGGSNSTAVIGTYSTTPNSWNTIEHIIDLDNDTAWVLVNGVNTNLGWQFSLGSSNMGDRFNAINFYSAANPGQTPKYYVDDFCAQPYVPVSCPAPTTLNVSSTNVGCDSAEVSWVSQSSSSSTILEYGPTGYTPGTGTVVPFVSSPYTITGLTAGTSYDFYVADTCTADTSSLAGPFTFSTNAAPVANASFTLTSSYTATTQDVTFDASGSSNADTYTWDFGNGNAGAGVNPTESYSLPNGPYSVKLTVTNDCGGTDDTTVTLNTNIGLNELANGQSFKVYPNPNSGEFIVEASLSGSKDNSIIITDVSGRTVYTKEINNASVNYSETFNLKDLPKGVYMLNLDTPHGKLIKRLVIE